MKWMSNYLRKVEKINIIIILMYGLSIFITLFHLPIDRIVYLVFDLIISMLILLVMDQLMKHEPIVHRSPFYYFTFLFLVTFTVYVGGGYDSALFPVIFFLPVLYISINFSRQGSTAVAILAITIMWLTLLQDPDLTKFNQTIFLSVVLLAVPQVFGFLVKEYVQRMKKLIKLRREANGK